jgi:D-serine deaminase-like pyridoxal phosphate-dependent protein
VRIEDLDTPVLTADLDAVERNIMRMQRYCDEHGLALRPHVKTHKLPEVARLQLAAGARGITCQKLGEAEVFADAGFDDILISFPLIGRSKIERLRALTERARVCVAVDSDQGVDALQGVDVEVLVECDTGGGRTGVQSPEAAALLAARADRFRGLMTYPMPPGTGPWLRAALDLIGDVETVSVGGTPTAHEAHDLGVATELRVGTYVYGDRACIANGSATLEDCALRVLATVVSTPTHERAILDAGTKALTGGRRAQAERGARDRRCLPLRAAAADRGAGHHRPEPCVRHDEPVRRARSAQGGRGGRDAADPGPRQAALTRLCPGHRV